MIRIRRAEAGDSEAIASVLHDSFIEYQALYAPERYAATVQSADGVLRRLQEGPSWVASIDDVIVGTVAAVKRPDGLYVRGMGIVPSARGHRIGERLLNSVETYASLQLGRAVYPRSILNSFKVE